MSHWTARGRVLGRLVLAGLVAVLAGCAARVPLVSPETSSTPVVDVVVARFLVDVEGLEGEFPGQAKGLLPATIEGIRVARYAQEALRTLRDPEGSPVKTAFDSIYAVVEADLAKMGFRLLPVDTLQGQVPYLIGYPMGRAADVARSGQYSRALDVEIYVDVPDQVTGSYSIIGTGKARTKGHPEMTLVMRMVDPTGHLLWRDDVRIRSKEKVELNERWLLGIRTEMQVPDASFTLPALTRQAMRKLIQRSRQG